MNELAKGSYAVVKSEATGDRQRKVYEVTDKGKMAYQEALKVWREVLPYVRVKSINISNIYILHQVRLRCQYVDSPPPAWSATIIAYCDS